MTQAEQTALEKRIAQFLPSMKAKSDDLKAKSDKEVQEYEERERLRKLEEWQKNCGLDADFYGADIKDARPEIKDQLLQFVDSVKNKEGRILVLIGSVGTGKTYSAAAVMNALGLGTYLDIPELELKLSTADRYGSTESREAVMHKLAKCQLLVLDEIGRFPHKRQQEQDVLFYLINKRYQNHRPTILCSNLNGEEFAQHLGEALIDRIKSRRVRIDLNGASLRGTK